MSKGRRDNYLEKRRQIHFFHFGVGTHHEGQAPEKYWEHSIQHQIAALNVGLIEWLQRLRQDKNLALQKAD